MPDRLCFVFLTQRLKNPSTVASLHYLFGDTSWNLGSTTQPKHALSLDQIPSNQHGALRLMFILSSQDVSLSQRGKNVPPEGLLPEEFQHYPWDIGTLLGKAEYKKHEFQSEAPMRQFYAFEDLEHVALRLGVFWTSPHWHYSPHVYKSLELHHRVCGQGQYFTSNGGQVDPWLQAETLLVQNGHQKMTSGCFRR